MLYQASDISPDVLNGTGCVDADEPLTVSWRLGGTTPLSAWQVDIYENLTPVYSTGKVTLSTPIYPLDPNGNSRRFSVDLEVNQNNKKCPPRYSGEEGAPLGVGGAQLFRSRMRVQNPSLVNGHEYRLLITQWDNANTETVQATPSVFLCRTTPALTLTAPSPCTSRTALVTAAYSQPEDDPIAQMRWTATVGDTPVHDSGTILGAAEPKLTLAGLLPDTECEVTLSVRTEAGASAAACLSFPVEYPLSPRRGEVIALSRDGLGCILVSWTRFAGAASYSVLRRQDDAESLERVADCPADVGSLRDYAVLAGHTYTYYVFPSSPYAYLTLPMVSEPVKADLTAFRLIEGETGEDGVFTPRNVHLFTCSDGDPMPGGISSNNLPSVRPGLSRYPVRLPSPSNYKSGILSGYVGDFNGVSGEELKAENCKKKNSLPLSEVQPVVNWLPVATQRPTCPELQSSFGMQVARNRTPANPSKRAGFAAAAELPRRVTEPRRDRGGPLRGGGVTMFAHAAAFKNLPFSSCVLLTPSGQRYSVATSGPIIEQTNYRTPKMPVSLRIPWVETGPAPTAVTTLISSGFLPADGVILSTFTVDPATGMLTETTEFTPHTTALCTILSIDEDGILRAAEPTEAPAAALTVDETGYLLAMVDDNNIM